MTPRSSTLQFQRTHRAWLRGVNNTVEFFADAIISENSRPYAKVLQHMNNGPRWEKGIQKSRDNNYVLTYHHSCIVFTSFSITLSLLIQIRPYKYNQRFFKEVSTVQSLWAWRPIFRWPEETRRGLGPNLLTWLWPPGSFLQDKLGWDEGETCRIIPPPPPTPHLTYTTPPIPHPYPTPPLPHQK